MAPGRDAYLIGGTPPFGHQDRLRAFVDRDLLGFEEVWAAAGTPDGVFPLTPGDLVDLSGAQPADIAEEPRGGSSPRDLDPG